MSKLKKCRDCCKSRAVEEFYKKPSYKDGLCKSCKACTLDYDHRRMDKFDIARMPATKICCNCKIEKPATDYTKRLRNADGLRSECKECTSTYEKSNRAKRRKADKFRKIYKAYGLTEVAYFAFLASQGGVCAICRKQARQYHVDHCHKTGKVRGILCYLCNVGLGSFRDDVERLGNAIQYLQETKDDTDLGSSSLSHSLQSSGRSEQASSGG